MQSGNTYHAISDIIYVTIFAVFIGGKPLKINELFNPYVCCFIIIYNIKIDAT